MTEEELTSTVRELKSGMSTLTDEWQQFLQMTAERQEEDALHRRRHEDSEKRKAEAESQKAIQEVEEWKKKQTFLYKHSGKIAAFIFAAVSSGLAAYTAQVRAEVAAEQQDKTRDADIENNKTEISANKGDIKELQDDSVDTTIMIEKGFRRVDKIILLAHPKELKEDELPDYPPEFKSVEDAEKAKIRDNKFGDDE